MHFFAIFRGIRKDSRSSNGLQIRPRGPSAITMERLTAARGAGSFSFAKRLIAPINRHSDSITKSEVLSFISSSLFPRCRSPHPREDPRRCSAQEGRTGRCSRCRRFRPFRPSRRAITTQGARERVLARSWSDLAGRSSITAVSDEERKFPWPPRWNGRCPRTRSSRRRIRSTALSTRTIPPRPPSPSRNTPPLPSQNLATLPRPPPVSTRIHRTTRSQACPSDPQKRPTRSPLVTELLPTFPAAANAAPTTPPFGDSTHEDRLHVHTVVRPSSLAYPTFSYLPFVLSQLDHLRNELLTIISTLPRPTSSNLRPSVTLFNNSSNSNSRDLLPPPLLAPCPSTTRTREAVRVEEYATDKEERCVATAVPPSTIE